MKRTNRLHLPWMLLLGAATVPLAFAATGCGDASSETKSDLGAVNLALITDEAGVTYRLTGVFEITGPEMLTIDTADDPNATVRSADLPIGSYNVTLQPGFTVEQDVGGGMFESVTANLITPNPRSFQITSQTTTTVTYSFGVQGQVIDFGEGSLDLDIDVEDQSNGPVALALGSAHTCARMANGAVRCWGSSNGGRLGYGNINDIGDDETPASAGDVHVGGVATQVVAGTFHTCATLDFGAVRCWGSGGLGQLGYGNINDIGDDETPASAGNVVIGAPIRRIAAGAAHTCALLDAGSVRCWGFANSGALGYGDTDTIGNNETPASAGDVDVGGHVVQIATGALHTCALLDTGAVRCWGSGFAGRLGYGNTTDIGDDETPASAGDVDVGGSVVQVAPGGAHTCALLDTGAVRCWGSGFAGQLGYGNTTDIGDDETPASAGDVDVGGNVVQIAAGEFHTCALLDTGAVRCWGLGNSGQLGYGDTDTIGDDETPASAGDVNLGAAAVQVAAGEGHTCALLVTGAVRCWGIGSSGRLGYGNTESIGDNEPPVAAGDVDVGFSTMAP